MNKYTAAGLAAEAIKGRRVLVLSHTVQASRQAAYDFDFAEDQASSIRRANGSTRITYPSGGRIDFRSQQSAGLRGISADVVLVDYPEVADVDMLRPIIAAFGGEIIRA